MLFGTGMGFFLMHWTHRCEMNTVKAMGSKSLEEVELYFKKANTIMPGNPYAWTQKYVIESNVLQQMLSSPQNNKGYYEYVESLFTEIRNDIDKMNGIIYGYQNTWQKLANLEIQEYQYYHRKYQQTGKIDAYKAFLTVLAKCVDDYSKSIEQNYLDANGRVVQMVAMNILDTFLSKQTDLVPFVRQYVQAAIYLNYARANKILASRIHISLSETTDSSMSMQVEKGKKNYYFVINENDVKSLSEKCVGCVNVNELTSTLNTTVFNLFDKNEFKELIKK